MFGWNKKPIAQKKTVKARVATAGAGMTAAAMIAASIAAPFTAHHEGLRLKAYLDPVGIPTICYGETLNVELGQEMTKKECDSLFELRLGWFAMMVDANIKPEIPATTHAALTSFTYNIGGEWICSITDQAIVQ